MILHANTVAKDRPARVGTSGIDGNDSNRAIFFSVVLGQLVDQRTFASARRASEAQNPRMPGLGEQRF
jgi:hypothetical protein